MSNVHEETRSEVTHIRELLAADSRERTAATILAALIQNTDGGVTEARSHSYVPCVVRLTDALRAELAKVKP